jgi:hypothetical protein
MGQVREWDEGGQGRGRQLVCVHAHEHVLDNVFPRNPVAEEERGHPDEFGAV